MLPLVAIIGRPNVGKSTLFNRLVGRPIAIVHDRPGVTRDRHYSDAHFHGRDFTVIDTGGFDLTSDDPMQQGIARHVQAAIQEADVIICILDGSQPPTSADVDSIKLLRRTAKPVIFIANKVDSDSQLAEMYDLHRLGLEDIIPVSALHGRGTHLLGDALLRALPAPETPDPKEADQIHVALVGRPNAGKSSLLNQLAREERSLVDATPGTTRDAVDLAVELEGRPFLIVDTAGVRRRTKVLDQVEIVSVMQSIRAIGRAQVVVLMVDGSGVVADQDARLMRLAVERGRAVVVALNKVDLLSPQERQRAEEQARRALHFAPWVPLLSISALTGQGTQKLVRQLIRSWEEFGKRVSTAELNRFFERVLAERPPPTMGGRSPRIYYITQAESAPPIFIAMTSDPERIQEAYKRFVLNQVRETFGFHSVPLTLRFRGKTRKTPHAHED